MAAAEAAEATAAEQLEVDKEEDAKAEREMKAALAAKGYDLVDMGSDSDSDGIGLMPGRIQALDPDRAREKGKKAFQAGKYDKAILCWQGGLKSILSSLCSGPEALKDMNLSELDLTLNLNIAMAYMKKEEFEMADRAVDKALARREALPDHLITKALYRKASVQRSMHRLEECISTLKDLLSVEEGNKAALQMMQEVDREWKMQCRQQKKNLKKLFDKLGDEDREASAKLKAEREELRRRSGVVWKADQDIDSGAFEREEVECSDGKDWGLSLTRTLLWAMEEFAVEGHLCLPEGDSHAAFWFIGASSPCELRLLQPQTLLTRLPKVRHLEVALIGFLGELTPENEREPDPKADDLPLGCKSAPLPDDPDTRVTLRVIKGTLQDAVATELKVSDTPEEEAAENPDEPPMLPTPQPKVPPTMAIIAHPQLHRYFSDFYPAIAWLVENNVPTVIVGPSDPDPSWKQDEVLLKAFGCDVVLPKRLNPYPMCLPNNPKVRKCNHIIGFRGGKIIPKDKVTRTKIDLLAKDYNVR